MCAPVFPKQWPGPKKSRTDKCGRSKWRQGNVPWKRETERYEPQPERERKRGIEREKEREEERERERASAAKALRIDKVCSDSSCQCKSFVVHKTTNAPLSRCARAGCCAAGAASAAAVNLSLDSCSLDATDSWPVTRFVRRFHRLCFVVSRFSFFDFFFSPDFRPSLHRLWAPAPGLS